MTTSWAQYHICPLLLQPHILIHNLILIYIYIHKTQKRTSFKVLMDSQFFVAIILSNASHHLISQIVKPLNHNFFEVWCENFQPLFKIQLELDNEHYFINSIV